jgi:hypothetical protein
LSPTQLSSFCNTIDEFTNRDSTTPIPSPTSGVGLQLNGYENVVFANIVASEGGGNETMTGCFDSLDGAASFLNFDPAQCTSRRRRNAPNSWTLPRFLVTRYTLAVPPSPLSTSTLEVVPGLMIQDLLKLKLSQPIPRSRLERNASLHFHTPPICGVHN